MRQVRFGSYSTAATFASTPSFVRLKSLTRYWRLWPPPLWRAVLWPCPLRPPVAGRGARRVFSGRAFVTSPKSDTLWKRRPALVGLRLRMAMASSALEQLDAVAGGDSDDGPLRVRPMAELVGTPGPLGLALAVHGVDLQHADAPDRLDGVVDLRFRGSLVDHERVGVGLDQ